MLPRPHNIEATMAVAKLCLVAALLMVASADECLLPPMDPSPETIQPVWLASFPGSGSELLRSLVEGLTGHPTDEVYNRASDCNYHPVLCKTHWPLWIGGHRHWGPVHRPSFADSSIVLLRNPLHAIPSFFNYKWEESHGVPDHSMQGSEEDWIEWRDRRFDGTLQAWKHLLETWDAGLYVVYEDLVDPVQGPVVLEEVGRLLEQVGTPVQQHSYDCLWKTVVQERATQKRRPNHTTPRFTKAQLTAMRDVLTSMENPALASVLRGYTAQVEALLLSSTQSLRGASSYSGENPTVG